MKRKILLVSKDEPIKKTFLQSLSAPFDPYFTYKCMFSNYTQNCYLRPLSKNTHFTSSALNSHFQNQNHSPWKIK